MRDGIYGKTTPVGFPYEEIIDELGTFYEVAPCLIAAIKMNETGLGQGGETENDISGDGGHGIMQLTSSWPSNWQQPEANIEYAVQHFLVPAWDYWRTQEQGDNLVRCIAATYNAGLGNAIAGHDEGNVDKYTTNDYAARALEHYHNLIDGVIQ